jgi:phosphomannomutase
MSDEYGKLVARVFGTMGIKVLLADKMVSSPMVSLAANKMNLAGGIMITASHNPPKYNGFKIKGDFGGSAHPEMIAEVEKLLPNIDKNFEPKSYEELESKEIIRKYDLRKYYAEYISKKFDLNRIKNSGLKIAYDSMYGSGQNLMNELAGITELHNEYNPSFGAVNPEPLEDNLKEFSEFIVNGKYDLGIAVDGDADRIGAIDERGNFVDSHKIFSLLLKYLYEKKNLRGMVVKTFSTTEMLNRIGEKLGLEIQVTPIGFKHVCKLMLEKDVLIGGEESGGIGVKGHIPERDGIYLGLLLSEMLIDYEKSLSELVADLEKEFGVHKYKRIDIYTTEEKKQNILKKCKSGEVETLNGFRVEKTENLDGFKFYVEGGWLLIRASGTEPILRYYSEAKSFDLVEKLLDAGINI